MSKRLSVTGTGDSLFVADFPAEYDAELSEIAKVIGENDIKITNLETNVSEFGDFGNAYSVSLMQTGIIGDPDVCQ